MKQPCTACDKTTTYALYGDEPDDKLCCECYVSLVDQEIIDEMLLKDKRIKFKRWKAETYRY